MSQRAACSATRRQVSCSEVPDRWTLSRPAWGTIPRDFHQNFAAAGLYPGQAGSG